MQTKLNKYLIVLTITAVLLANTALSFAENGMESFRLTTDFEDSVNQSGLQDPEDPILDGPVNSEQKNSSQNQGVADDSQKNDGLENLKIGVDDTAEKIAPADNPAIKQEEFLSRVKQEINLTKTDYHQLLNSISDTKKRLELVSEEKLTLQDQLSNLDYQIDITKEKLLAVIKQIIEKENEITLLYEEIEVREVALEYQKSLLKDYIRLIYQEENTFLTINEDGSVGAFKLLLSDGNISETLKKLHYFDLLNETGQQIADNLDLAFKELEGQKIEINEKKEALTELQGELTLEKDQLELQKESKQQLLRITLGQEEIYKQLLEQTQKEQEQLVNDIKNLSNALNFIEVKIAEDGENFDSDKYLALLDYKTQVLYNFQVNNPGLGIDGLAWPVDPDRGISAYFRDAAYAGAFGVQHNAIDIPEYQGSPVRAAADSVVYTARNNGYGYSYVILAHAGGLMTVYGHLSFILVEEGQTITQGSIIGLSGGMPGTKGAGYMTTGPHLHFEVLQNGLYTDPLDYLPMEVFTEEQGENLPEKYKDDWEAAVLEPIRR